MNSARIGKRHFSQLRFGGFGWEQIFAAEA
jgi:hypothetical protein